MAPPQEIKAVIITQRGTAEVKTVPLPTLPDDHILVRTTAVGLNPTDWMHVHQYEGTEGTRSGCDYAGVVEQVGPSVTKPFVKGDRICGFVHGANRLQPERGTFGEYIIVKGDLQIKIPDNLTDEEAASLGVGVTTVAQGLYQALQLPLPKTTTTATKTTTANPPPEILIYGGSTATGLLGIQFAVLSGYRVATTCSPSNAAYLRSLGASGVFDYRSATVADDIRAWSRDADAALTLAWDCISTADSARICARAMSRTRDGRYRSLLVVEDEVVKAVNERVESGWTLGYTILGEAVVLGSWAVAAVEADFEFGKMFWELARGLLARGEVKPARRDVNRGGEGLEGVLVGLGELRESKVSGVKLVYTM